MGRAIVSGIATGPFFLIVPNNSPRSHCESLLGPVSLSFLK